MHRNAQRIQPAAPPAKVPQLSKRAMDPERERIARAAIEAVRECKSEDEVLFALAAAFPGLAWVDLRTAIMAGAIHAHFTEQERVVLSATLSALSRSVDAISMRRLAEAFKG